MSNRKTRRGGVTLTAVLMLGMVGSAAAMTAAVTTRDARRTNDERTRAELRELLAAGLDAVEATGEATKVSLPDAVRAAGGDVTLRVEPSGDREVVTIHARYGGKSAEQRSRLVRYDGKWEVEQAG